MVPQFLQLVKHRFPFRIRHDGPVNEVVVPRILSCITLPVVHPTELTEILQETLSMTLGDSVHPG